MNETNTGPRVFIFFSLLAPSAFQTFLFSNGWGKFSVSNPAGRYYCPVPLFSDSLCIFNTTTLSKLIYLRDRHILSWEIYFLPDFALPGSQQSIDFLKNSSFSCLELLLLCFYFISCGISFLVLVFWFITMHLVRVIPDR